MDRSTKTIDHIRSTLCELPEVAAWPELRQLIQREVKADSNPCWEYPFPAAQAFAKQPEVALPATIGIFGLFYSIHLVDDLLDEDPRGIQHRHGVGAAANFAVALQAAGCRAVALSDLDHRQVDLLQTSLNQAALATAYGQHQDAQDPEGEEGYWRVVRAKTPPLFECGLYCGAVCAGASHELATSLSRLGTSIGLIVQIGDDLHDAMEKTASVDWQRRSTNLPILYARTADHPEQKRFMELLQLVDHDSSALEEAQEILVRCGAMSFCAYKIIESYQDGLRGLKQLDLPHSQPLEGLLSRHVEPVRAILRSAGVKSVDQLVEG